MFLSSARFMVKLGLENWNWAKKSVEDQKKSIFDFQSKFTK